MTILAEDETHVCYLVGHSEARQADEIELFCLASIVCFMEDDPAAQKFREMAEKETPDVDFGDREIWEHIFFDPRYVHFVLFTKPGAAEQLEIKGVASIYFEDEILPPELTNRHILSRYRGQGLAKLTYEAQLKYLAEYTNHREVSIQIEPTNTPNLRAAKSAGFDMDHYEVIQAYGRTYHIFKRSLDDLRPKPDATPGEAHDSLDDGP